MGQPTLTTMPMIKAVNLHKNFGQRVAVGDVSLEVQPGELFGFLGPNGAGKTTTIKMLVGLLNPSSGTAEICGYNMHDKASLAKLLLGYVPDSPGLYDKLTGNEMMQLSADLYGVEKEARIERIDSLLDAFGLSPYANELCQSYSRGMKQKLSLCSALLHDPKVLFLDEPTVGLDPAGAKQLKSVLRSLCAEGRAVFLSTHVLEVAELLCDRIGIVMGGNIIAIGTPEEIRAQAGSSTTLEEAYLAITGGATEGDVGDIIRAWK